MSITKEGAIRIIDGMLKCDFEQFVSDTCNELIAHLNDAAADGKRKVKGKKLVGYNLRGGYVDVKLKINQEFIMQCALASISSSSMPYKNIVTFSKEFDLFYDINHDEHTRAFSFKFFTFWGKFTRTGKRFISEVSARLNKYGFKLKFPSSSYGVFRLQYSCSIPQNFKQLPLHGGLDFSKHLKDMDTVAQELREKFTERSVKEKQEPDVKKYHFVFDTGLGRTCPFDVTFSAKERELGSYLSLGWVREDMRDELIELIEAYNDADGFSLFKLTAKILEKDSEDPNDKSLLLIFNKLPLKESEDVVDLCKKQVQEIENLLATNEFVQFIEMTE